MEFNEIQLKLDVYKRQGISGRDKYFDGIATWEVNREGRITGLQPIAGVAPTPGLGKNAVFSFTKSSLKQGRQMHSLYKLGRCV